MSSMPYWYDKGDGVQRPIFRASCSSLHRIMAAAPRTRAEKIQEKEKDIDERVAKIALMKEGGKLKENAENALLLKKNELSLLLESPHDPNDFGIPQGAKTYVVEKLKNSEAFYKENKSEDFWAKATEKGKLCEEAAIELIGEHLFPFECNSKNTVRFWNDWLEGEPDVILSKIVYDSKCPETHKTMPIFTDTETCDTDYEWQIQGYMVLLQVLIGFVVYALMDTPLELIKQKYGQSDEEYYKIVDKQKYSHLAIEKRLTWFRYDFDAVKMEEAKERVRRCQEYSDYIYDKFMSKKIEPIIY